MQRSTSAFDRWLAAAVFAVIVTVATIPVADTRAADTPRLLDQADTAALIHDLETTIPELVKKGRFPGLQIALIRDGNVVWHKGIGVKNANTGEPVTGETIFEAASLTKPMFAYAVMRLVDEGLLDLDTPLLTHFSSEEIEGFLGHPLDAPGFHREWAEIITGRHVLSHSAGMPHGESGDVYPLFFEPGTQYKYSAAGYGLLQKVVERLTEQRLDAIIAKYVLNPLGMTHSSMVWRDEYETTMANGHGMLGRPEDFRKYQEPHAAASLYTTASDYARFVCAVLNGEGLERETLREMLTPQIKADEEMGVSWSLGFGIQEDANGRAFWQWGDYGIFRNYVLAYPEQKLGVVYLTNSFLGLGICHELVSETIGGQALGITFLDYRQYDSPMATFCWAVNDRGPEVVEELLPKMKEEHPEEFTTWFIGWLGREFADAGKTEEGIALLEFNVNDDPESPRAHADLARVWLEMGDREKARRFYDKALLLADNDDEFDTATVDWVMAYINALEQPADVPADFLQRLVGDYETRHFELRDDGLYYMRGDVSTGEYRKLTPMSKDMFLIEGLIYFRMSFEFDDDGRPTKVVGLYETGYRDESVRDE